MNTAIELRKYICENIVQLILQIAFDDDIFETGYYEKCLNILEKYKNPIVYLIKSCKCGYSDIINLVIKSFTYSDKYFRKAHYYSHIDIAKLIIEKGVNWNESLIELRRNDYSQHVISMFESMQSRMGNYVSNSNTSLLNVCSKGHIDIMEILMICANNSYKSLLCISCDGYIEIVKFYINKKNIFNKDRTSLVRMVRFPY